MRRCASVALGVLLAVFVGACGSAGDDSDSLSRDEERLVGIVSEYREPMIAWTATEAACDDACESGEALLARYRDLLDLARAFQVDLTVAEPAPADLRDIAARTKARLRDVRDNSRELVECLDEHIRDPDACNAQREDAERASEDVPDLFEAWSDVS